MTFVTLTGIAASASGVAMALSPLLQARRVRAIGDSSEVSTGLFAILMGNGAVWLLRGVVTSDPVLIVPNVVAIVAAGATLVVVRRHRHASRSRSRDGATIDSTGAPRRAERAADRPPTVRT